MRTIITITEYPSMRGRYKAKVKRSGERDFECECGRGEYEAAAKAVDLAIGQDAVIVASKKIMELIPKELGGLK